MNYQSPIEVIQTEMRRQIEGEIYKAVMNVGVNVDKDELIKALEYDRGQYQKGYYDRDSEIVRCKDCKHSEHWYKDKYRCFFWHETGIDVFEDGFCNYGKHKET